MQQLDPNKIKGDKRADVDRQASGMGTPDSVPPSALSMPPTPNSSSFMDAAADVDAARAEPQPDAAVGLYVQAAGFARLDEWA